MKTVFKIGGIRECLTVGDFYYHMLDAIPPADRDGHGEFDFDIVAVESVEAGGAFSGCNIINLILFVDSPIYEEVEDGDVGYSMEGIGALLSHIRANVCFLNDVLTARIPGRDPVLVEDRVDFAELGRRVANAPVRESEVIAIAVRDAAARIKSVFRRGDLLDPLSVEELILERIALEMKAVGIQKE